MRKGFAGFLLFAFMLPGYGQAQQQSSAALPSIDVRQQGELPAGCDNNLGSVPGGAKEYNLFKNMTASSRGCTAPSPVTYEKMDGQKADGRSAPARSVAPQQEEADRGACHSEGENAAKAARGLQPGEYDIFKNIAAAQSGEADRVEQSCMAERGYKKLLN